MVNASGLRKVAPSNLKVFGRLNREQISLDLAMELAELAEKDADELRQLTAALVLELKS